MYIFLFVLQIKLQLRITFYNQFFEEKKHYQGRKIMKIIYLYFHWENWYFITYTCYENYFYKYISLNVEFGCIFNHSNFFKLKLVTF
jgi:hypothetical protein